MNSNWRSARRSSSRKQRAIWKYFSKPDIIRICLKSWGDCGSAYHWPAVNAGRARGSRAPLRASSASASASRPRGSPARAEPCERGRRSRRAGRSSSASPAAAGRGSGTRAAAPRSRSCGPRRRRAASRSAPGSRGSWRRPRSRRSEAPGCAGPRRAGRRRPRSRRRPRCAPRPPPSTASAGQRARSKTTWTRPLRSRIDRKISSPRSRRRPTQPFSSTVRPASEARSSPAACRPGVIAPSRRRGARAARPAGTSAARRSTGP